ncbi:MAG: ribonuclease E/G [Geminicoccaceae bacterium]
MSLSLVLEDTGFGLRAAVVEEDRLVELLDADVDAGGVTERLFLARVTSVDKGLGAAFLDVGLAEPGFLAAKDARAAKGAVERRPIQELVAEGDRLIVQGLRESVGDKGPRFTADPKLLGMALIYQPFAGPRDVSRPGKRDAEAVRQRVEQLFPEGGMMARRFAADLGDAALLAEGQALQERWKRLRAAADATKRPGPLVDGETPLARLLQHLPEPPERIVVGDGPLAIELKRLMAERPVLRKVAVERLPPGVRVFVETGVDNEIEAALGEEVPLPGGGRILIQPTAACVAIDVDGGGRGALATNLAAAAEVGRQLRLRNLGGTVVIDFIDLPAKGERQRVEDALRKALRQDPLPVQVYPMSPLGLVELSRARRGEPLAARFRRTCPTCDGNGSVPSLRASAEALLGELGSARTPPREVRVASDLAGFLEPSPAWERTRSRLGPLALTVDPTLAPGGYRLA